MSKRQKVTLKFPAPFGEMTVPRHVEKVLRLVQGSGSTGISTLGLTEAGCINPGKAICKLRKLGAVIVTELKDVLDPKGEIRPQVAHYTFRGWRVDANWVLNEYHAYKDQS
jgi:hypothetical protein